MTRSTLSQLVLLIPRRAKSISTRSSSSALYTPSTYHIPQDRPFFKHISHFASSTKSPILTIKPTKPVDATNLLASNNILRPHRRFCSSSTHSDTSTSKTMCRVYIWQWACGHSDYETDMRHLCPLFPMCEPQIRELPQASRCSSCIINRR